MPRAYTVATAALALGTSTKWVDNTLSHYRILGVTQARQGVARRLSLEALLNLSVALLLTSELGTTLAVAIRIAEQSIANGGAFNSPGGLQLQLNLDTLRARLDSRLEEAVEVAPVPHRGRPPKNKTGRLE
jgi:hypothetical protein